MQSPVTGFAPLTWALLQRGAEPVSLNSSVNEGAARGSKEAYFIKARAPEPISHLLVFLMRAL
jgi:hypothetical protein